jgi:transposase-like protein
MTYFPCEDEHSFEAVLEYGRLSHYVCRSCNIKVSDERYDKLMSGELDDEEDEDYEDEYDIVDDDDMC